MLVSFRVVVSVESRGQEDTKKANALFQQKTVARYVFFGTRKVPTCLLPVMTFWLDVVSGIHHMRRFGIKKWKYR